MNKDINLSVKNIVGAGAVKENLLLKDLTTFRVGGPAELYAEPHTVTELSSLIKLLEETGTPWYLLGNGSNLLVSDKGFKGVVIRLAGDFQDLTVDPSTGILTAGAGVQLSKVCTLARDNSLTGLEFAYGIPGTVGGAMVMNAGAYDGEMSFVVKEVHLIDRSGRTFSLSKDEMEFSYRNSILKREPFIVCETVFELAQGDREAISAKMQDFMARRRSKQPLELPSAGSTFKRPEGYFAGKLIQDAGLAGFSVGGAMVSPKHCGFVVNFDGATASDINELMNRVVETVYKASGVRLEPEVIKVGEF